MSNIYNSELSHRNIQNDDAIAVLCEPIVVILTKKFKGIPSEYKSLVSELMKQIKGIIKDAKTLNVNFNVLFTQCLVLYCKQFNDIEYKTKLRIIASDPSIVVDLLK
jgi:hypothetical protein